MVPSTGYLKLFDLEPIEGGFTLRFPRRHQPDEIAPLGTDPKLLDTFRLYGNQLELLGIQSVGALNDAICEGRIREVILFSEALHEQRIADIASQIAARIDELRLVLIAGPSSAGKTTTSRRLSIQLLAHGIQPYTLELDNYFVDCEKTPRDENGDYDYDHIDAFDIAQFNQDLNKLITAERVQLPKYDLRTTRSELGEVVKLKQGQIIIIEGIHGLNPELVKDIPENQVFRIYISALTQLNLDRLNRFFDNGYPVDPEDCAGCEDARIYCTGYDLSMGVGTAGRKAIYIPLPGERGYHAQLCAGL
jgi:uridine kinase